MGAGLVVFKILFLVLIAHYSGWSRCLVGAHTLEEEEASANGQLALVRPLQPLTGIASKDSLEATASREENKQQRQDSSSIEKQNFPQNSDADQNQVIQTRDMAAFLPSLPSQSSAGATDSGAGQQQQANYAELCYLSNGGSSLTLTVNEATQVGSIIGAVEVNGDPALEGGNVDLFDAPLEPPVVAPMQSVPMMQRSGELGDHLSHSAKLRRILGKRWTTSQTGASLEDNSVNKTRGSRMVAGGGGPPPLMGLVASEHSASFYSLLATQSPVTTQQQAPPATSPPQQPPVRLEPGTKNLILIRPLDKEGAEGEQSLVIQVRCSPRATALPSEANLKRLQLNRLEATTIPVRILITDANDHAPEFVGSLPYVVNISETAPIGSVASRDILALDKDSAGPFSTIHYRVLDDGQPHSMLLHFANPLDPTLLVAGQLDYEQVAQFSLTLVAQDQGEPEPLSSSVQLQVNVIGQSLGLGARQVVQVVSPDFDDQNPRFMDDKYTLAMDESQQSLVGQNLQVLPRNLYAEDGDRGIQAPILYSFDHLVNLQQHPAASSSLVLHHQQQPHDAVEPNAQSIEHYLHLNPSSGEIRLIRQWPSRWSGPPMTLVVRATQADNKDRYTLTTLTILPSGSSVPRSTRWELASSKLDTTNNNPGKGIEFSPDRLNISVLESVPINEKIARVRARYMPDVVPSSTNDDDTTTQAPNSQEAPVDLVAQVTGKPEQTDYAAGRGARRTRVSGNEDNKRPINYQILGDQTDQFGINGLGDIFVKRQLDYEQRQQYKFRVLATYTKYSDICQVQVNIINVNDNKPKFTQPQYSFHVGESRLRSNQVGFVQAHDADLNDTIQYSLLGEHAHLFDISPGGLISLKPSTRQLDMGSCQLVAQASDTLAPPMHSHQARIQLQIAQHLVGRPLGHLLLASSSSSSSPLPLDDPSNRLFNSRSLLQQRENTAFNNRQGFHQNPPNEDLTAHQQQQRSSVATVMSSLQHMVRSVNLFDMPISSALLLSALLAFLICLLFIVIISMSVHLYRRRHKQRQRHQMAAAASRLRNAHLTAALQPSATGSSRYHLTGVPSNSSSSSDLSPRGPTSGGSNSSSSRNSGSGSPTTTTSATGQAQQVSSQMNRMRQQEKQSQVSFITNDEGQPLENTTNELKLKLGTALNNDQPSLISSLVSSQSKSSYTTDDSSVMHCGHYSVNSSSRFSPSINQLAAPLRILSQEPSKDGSDLITHNNFQQRQQQDKLKAKLALHQQMVAAAASVAATTKLRPNELSVLTTSQPGIKAYRKLPQGLGSLVRQQRNNRVSPEEDLAKVNDLQIQRNLQHASNNSDSAIASDVSSSSHSTERHLKEQLEPNGGLMALIRSPERVRPTLSKFPSCSQHPPNDSVDELLSPVGVGEPSIRWPPNSIPHKVKKLTWDDGGEQEQDDEEDCFVAPEIQLGGPISPLSNHQYPIQGTTGNEDHYAEQHFLFSNPCSPSQQLHSNSSDFANHSTTSFNQQHRQENCFDYTIVQSSQFRVDSLQQQQQHHQQSLSAQHHLLQQQQQQHQQEQKQRPTTSYLYSNNTSGGKQSVANQEDLKLMTTAVL